MRGEPSAGRCARARPAASAQHAAGSGRGGKMKARAHAPCGCRIGRMKSTGHAISPSTWSEEVPTGAAVPATAHAQR